MLLRPTHSRVIKPAAITGRDLTARYSAVRDPTAAWRALAQGGPHQKAMAIPSLRSRLLPPDDQDGNEESPRDASAHGQAEHVASDQGPRSAAQSTTNHRLELRGIAVALFRCTSGTDISIPLYTSFIPSHALCLRSYN
jgi:hypothetical protein